MTNSTRPFLEMKDRLDGVSRSFCLAKWFQVTLHLHDGKTHSCHHPIRHPIPLDELRQNPTALHNTEFKKSLRKQMLSGKRPRECGYCWAVEDLPSKPISDRYIKSADFWAKDRFEEAATGDWERDFVPSYVEVSFSRSCNFKCSYCSPEYSTSWQKELQTHGVYRAAGYMEHLADYQPPSWDENDNPYIEAFWEWWPELREKLQVLRITGGEPLLSENTFRVLGEMKKHPRPRMELAVNSNLGVSSKTVERLAQAIEPLTSQRLVKDFTVYTSVEGWGKAAEYVRFGMNFENFWSNVELLLKSCPGLKLVINGTFNALSLTTFDQLIDGVTELKKKYPGQNGLHRVMLDCSYLTQPDFHSVRVLSQDYVPQADTLVARMEGLKRSVIQQDWGFYDYEVEKLRRIVDWMKKPISVGELETLRKRFYRFFSEYDRRRNTEFLAAFPEMAQFWETCRAVAARKWF